MSAYLNQIYMQVGHDNIALLLRMSPMRLRKRTCMAYVVFVPFAFVNHSASVVSIVANTAVLLQMTCMLSYKGSAECYDRPVHL